MTNQQVADAFAYGKSGNGLHIYTDGKTIWSYGSHFPMATYKDGLMFFNQDKYSRTTSRHQSLVKRALGLYNGGALTLGNLRLVDTATIQGLI